MQHCAALLRHANTIPPALGIRFSLRARPSCACRWNSTTTVGLKKPRRQVSTLDPSKLTIEHYIELQGYGAPMVTFGGRRAQLHYANTSNAAHIKFPPHARGYLYFDRPDPCPHVASGTLKFRVAEKDPDVRAAFDAGHDLRMPNGWEVWSTHLLALRRSTMWKPAYDLLRAEALVTDAQDLRIAQLVRDAQRNPRTGAAFKFDNRTTARTVLEPFPVDFSTNILSLVVLDPDEIRSVFLQHYLAAGLSLWRSPFSGIGLVRFEAAVHVARSPWTRYRLLTDPTQPVLVLRLLEWLKPPTGSPLPQTPTQVPGTLITKLWEEGDREYPSILSPTVLPEKSWAMLQARDLPL